jgi:hypothetical protein
MTEPLEPTVPPNRSHYQCLDCAVDTALVGEYYQLTDEVWASLFQSRWPGKEPGDAVGMLCIFHVEVRLGRELTPADFDTETMNALLAQEDSGTRTMAPIVKDRFLEPVTVEVPEPGATTKRSRPKRAEAVPQGEQPPVPVPVSFDKEEPSGQEA